jgi:hypothetical protein
MYVKNKVGIRAIDSENDYGDCLEPVVRVSIPILSTLRVL